MKIQKTFNRLLTVITFLIIGIGIANAASQNSDASKADEKQNLNNPTRYAFISDKTLPKLAVFDTQAQRVLPMLDLQTTAEIAVISREGGYLLYAKRGDKAVYRLDLSTQKQQRITVPHAIDDFTVQGEGRWLAYRHSAGVSLVDISKIDAQADTVVATPAVTVATTGAVSLLFHPTQDRLFIAELSRGRLQRLDLTNAQSMTLFDSGQPMSPISVMPNGMALFFASAGKLQRYSLLDEELQPLEITAADLRPYITGDSRKILLLKPQASADATRGELQVVNAYTYKVVAKHALNHWRLSPSNNRDFLATGWLEQVAVLADDKAFYSLTVDGDSNATTHHATTDDDIDGAVVDMLVQSDSKTLLMTQENSDKLHLFDLRTRRFTAKIALGLAQPAQVLMGATNTLCH